MARFVDVRQRLQGLRPQVWVAVGLSALLLGYSNGTSGFAHDSRERFLLWTNITLMVALLVLARGGLRLSWEELGLHPRAVPGSAAVGLGLSVLAAVVPVAFIGLVPVVTGEPVEAEVTDRSGAWMAYYLAFRQPVGTALFEEVAFRGILYGAWQRVGGDRTAFWATSGVFAAWHLVITSRTVAESGVVGGPPMIALGVIVSLAGLFVGGLIFAYLRWHTRSIAAAVMAHWLIVAAISVTVWAVG